MKIIGVSALQQEGDDFATITITAKVSRREELEEGDLTRILGAIREAAGETDSVNLKGESGPASTGRRSRSSAADAEPETPTRGRGRAAAADAESESPRTRSRSRGASDADEQEEKPARGRGRAAKEEPAEEPRRSRRAAAKDEPDEPSDSDLMKAASGLAAKVGPKVGKLILEEKGVSKVNELKGADRQWFIDECQKEIELAEEEGK